jgi:hypothetical protein
VAKLRHENSFSLAEKYESLSHQYLDHASNPNVLASLDGKAAVFAAAIATDKMQLLRNQPTSITQHVNSESLTVVLQQVLNEITTSTEQE